MAMDEDCFWNQSYEKPIKPQSSTFCAMPFRDFVFYDVTCMESSLGFSGENKTSIQAAYWNVLGLVSRRKARSQKEEATGSKLAKRGAIDAGRNVRVENERESSIQKLDFTLYVVALEVA
jgi:hypothetical protein